jgi:hypothetical protein
LIARPVIKVSPSEQRLLFERGLSMFDSVQIILAVGQRVNLNVFSIIVSSLRCASMMRPRR